jgi:hypothetical protein
MIRLSVYFAYLVITDGISNENIVLIVGSNKRLQLKICHYNLKSEEKVSTMLSKIATKLSFYLHEYSSISIAQFRPICHRMSANFFRYNVSNLMNRSRDWQRSTIKIINVDKSAVKCLEYMACGNVCKAAIL